MKVQQLSNCVHSVTASTQNIPLLIVSDVHFDSLKCDRASLKRHFDDIKKRNGQILIIGDWFDVMGCHKDPRSKAADIDPAYIQKGRSYLDLVREDSYEFLKPYRDNLLFMSYGNHETSILKHRDTDPLRGLIYMLNEQGGKEVQLGAYAGWVNFILQRSGGRSSRSFMMCYHHGKGGNAKRSKGILYSQMDALEYPDANLIVSGHDHNKIYDPSNVRRRVCPRTGRIYHDTVHWIKTGSYKKSANDFGYEVQKGFTPKRLGGWYVDLNYVRSCANDKDIAYIECDVKEAKPVRSFE